MRPPNPVPFALLPVPQSQEADVAQLVVDARHARLGSTIGSRNHYRQSSSPSPGLPDCAVVLGHRHEPATRRLGIGSLRSQSYQIAREMSLLVPVSVGLMGASWKKNGQTRIAGRDRVQEKAQSPWEKPRRYPTAYRPLLAGIASGLRAGLSTR